MIVDENLRSKRTSNYPEALSIHKVKGQNVQLRFYGQDSDYNRLAMISHYLHNTDLLSAEDRKIAVGYIKDFIRSIKPDASDEHTSMICENPFQSSLFDNLFDVPFPEPEKPSFTFIDLFAGIGGIRIPFTELNGKCVFSSEWDRAAQTTYTSNFGEIPFGDITKIRADFIPRHDILLAGFPC